MQLFTHYIEPLISWLHVHPQAALFITFLIAFLESLAIIGSLIPGSVTMTAIGILAGSGILRIDLTLIAAMLGAIAGDGASYLLGFFFSDRLTSLWPFNRYPSLLAYGQLYFEKHGGKSVLIGRFVGPLRSIIPVIAGMLHMSKWRFFIANILSGIGWAILYVTPGILIGAASHELSPERATRLLLFVLLVLVGTWLMSLGVKSIFIRFRSWFQTQLHSLWTALLIRPYLKPVIRLITPRIEKDHTATAALVLLLLTSTVLFLTILYLQLHDVYLSEINAPIHLFLQSIRTEAFDIFFAISEQMISLITIVSLFIGMFVYSLYKKDFKGCAQWVVLGLTTILFISMLHRYVPGFRPSGILEPRPEHPFPATNLTLASMCFIALLFHNRQYGTSFGRSLFSFLLISALCLGNLSIIYLGDNWFSDALAALLAGLTLAVCYWIIYRKTHLFWQSDLRLFPVTGLILFSLATTLSCCLNLKSSLLTHETYFKQHVLSDTLWWQQDKPILPLYSKNRLGHITNTFNIQYVGRLKALQTALLKAGWKTDHATLFKTVLKKVDGKHAGLATFFPSVYLNQKPKLTLIYQPYPASPIVQLQLWRSNYYVEDLNTPIWLGSVQTLPHFRAASQDAALSLLKKTLPNFKQHSHRLHQNRTRTHFLLLLRAPTEQTD